jgi:putative ABC transport system substrate-binding protein
VPQRAPAIFAELLARGVDVMMLAGERWLHLAAQQATRTIPIVATIAEDPVATGLISTLARPGGNLTGIALSTGHELTLKRLELFKELAPHIGRVAYLATPSAVEQYRGGASFPGTSVVLVQVDRPEQYEEAFATIQRERADSLMASSSPLHYVNARRIVAFAAESRLPAMYAFREAVAAGGLVSYGANAPGLWRQAARLVDRILKGARSADLPVEQPTKFELVINLKTAKVLGLTIPPSLLARVDEVIE